MAYFVVGTRVPCARNSLNEKDIGGPSVRPFEIFCQEFQFNRILRFSLSEQTIQTTNQSRRERQTEVSYFNPRHIVYMLMIIFSFHVLSISFWGNKMQDRLMYLDACRTSTIGYAYGIAMRTKVCTITVASRSKETNDLKFHIQL